MAKGIKIYWSFIYFYWLFHVLPRVASCVPFNSQVKAWIQTTSVMTQMEIIKWFSWEESRLRASWTQGYRRPSLGSHACMTVDLLTQTKTIIFADLGDLTWLECGKERHMDSDFSTLWVLVHSHVPLPYTLGFLKICVCPNSPLNFIIIFLGSNCFHAVLVFLHPPFTS